MHLLLLLLEHLAQLVNLLLLLAHLCQELLHGWMGEFQQSKTKLTNCSATMRFFTLGSSGLEPNGDGSHVDR